MASFLRGAALVLAVILGAVGSVLVVLGLNPDLQRLHRWCAMAAAFIPYGVFLWAATLILVLLAARKAWRLLALIPVAALGLQLVWANEYFPGIPRGTGSDLRVVSFNTLYGKSAPAETAASLQATHADVIVLLEASVPLVYADPMAPLLESYPYQVGTLAPGYVAAGYEDASATYVLSKRPVTIIAQLDAVFDQFVVSTTTRDDSAITIIAAHPSNMVGGTARWVEEANTLASAVEDHASEPLMVIGDLNATPENLTYRTITNAGVRGAADQARAGWVPTFNVVTGAPALIPIDHALVNDQVTAQRFSTFRVAGSDHRGIVVDVTVP